MFISTATVWAWRVAGEKRQALDAFHGIFIEPHAKTSYQLDPGNVARSIDHDLQYHGPPGILHASFL
jgi:hypothetical protein